jgi:hypothetical protein
MPSTVTSASTTPTSTVALHESDETLNVDLTEELEEMDTFTTADIEVDGTFPMQITTPLAESISWSGKKIKKINETDEYNNLTTTTETVISTESSLEDTTLTVVYLSTTSTLVSNNISVQSENSSTERSAELSTNIQIQFSEDIKNKNVLQEIKLEIPADSHQVAEDTSLKADENVSTLSSGYNYEKVKVKRHAKMKDKEGMKTLK